MGKKKPPPQFKREALDAVVALLVRGYRTEQIAATMRTEGVLAPQSTARYIAEARRLVTLSADYVRDEELGRAIRRLNDIYSEAVTAKELKIRLDAVKELSRLMRLSDAGDPDGDGPSTDANTDLAAIREHLEPLQLGPAGLPVVDLVRLAVDRLLPHLTDE